MLPAPVAAGAFYTVVAALVVYPSKRTLTCTHMHAHTITCTYIHALTCTLRLT